MARGPLTFRQRDVVAAIKAAKRAGVENFRVEIDKEGLIAIIVAGDDPAAAGSEWDVVFDEPASALH